MKIKYLSPVLASIAFSLIIAPVLIASTSSSNQAIYCQTSGEIPTTIATRADGEDFPIFHWKDEVLPEYLNPQELCAEVSQKLQDYAAGGHRLSSFKTYDLDGIPLICAEENTGDCSLVLFSLNATDNQGDSNMILGRILDDELKGEEIISIERGVQFYGYKVNFWSLLGL